MGNAYGITGPNGVGKTTILNTILGLYNKELPPNVLKINGFYYNDIDFEFLRRNSIATTEQEPILLPGSLLENIYLWSNYNKDTYAVSYTHLYRDYCKPSVCPELRDSPLQRAANCGLKWPHRKRISDKQL